MLLLIYTGEDMLHLCTDDTWNTQQPTGLIGRLGSSNANTTSNITGECQLAISPGQGMVIAVWKLNSSDLTYGHICNNGRVLRISHKDRENGCSLMIWTRWRLFNESVTIVCYREPPRDILMKFQSKDTLS